MTRDEQWRTVGRVVAVIAPLGALLGLIPGYFLGDGSARSMLAGALIGTLIAGGIAAFDAAWAVGLVPRRWREAPFLVVLITRSLTWITIIVVGIALPLVTVGQVPLDALTSAPVLLSMLVSFVIALLINFVGQVNRLLGRGVLVRLILGQYHRPRQELRTFLLIDLRGSTSVAEQLGDLRYHGFLKRFIADVTASATRHGAEVHRYVGDEIILTWPQDRGRHNADCVRTVFAIADALDASKHDYEATYGVVPGFWAALHSGPVVTGEIGTVKHEIVYLGDTLNVAARIEEACRTLQRPFLASGAALEEMSVPTDVEVEQLGAVDLRGIHTSIELAALSR